MLKKKKDPAEAFGRKDGKSTLVEDHEDTALRERVAGNKDSAKIRKLAEKIEQGP